MKKQYWVVTDGLHYAYWSRMGTWSVHDTLETDCLLDETEARSVARQFNALKGTNELNWVVKEGWLELPE